MFLTKKLQNSSFKEVISLENTFPDSFTGNGLTDIFLPDFDNQRITVLMNLNLELLNSIRKNISGSFDSNPLEMEVAFIFAALFIVMAAITQFVTTHFGNLGLQI